MFSVSGLIGLGLAFAAPCRGALIPFQVNFSGGNGSPVTITLPQALTTTVTNTAPNVGPFFVIQGVNWGGGAISVSTTLSYTIDGTSPVPINAMSGGAGGVDLRLFQENLNDWVSLNVNDVLVLSSGTMTTQASFSGPAPASGLYTGILVDKDGNQQGVLAPVPEPSSLCLIAVAVPLLLTRRRSRTTNN